MAGRIIARVKKQASQPRKLAFEELSSRPNHNENVTPEVASYIANVLWKVMSELRALNELAVQSDCGAFSEETLAELTQAVCERSHVKLDACAVRLGAMRLGNYEPPFAEVEDAAEGENHG